MAFVQVKNTLQTWKLAAFIVAFFSPFFANSSTYSDSVYDSIQGSPPMTESRYGCIGAGAERTTSDTVLGCVSFIISTYSTETHHDFKNVLANGLQLTADYEYCSSPRPDASLCYRQWSPNYNAGIGRATGPTEYLKCPEGDGENSHGRDITSNGVIDECYSPEDVEEAQEAEQEEKKKEEFCENLVLDSGNNSSNDLCFSDPVTGNSCSVVKSGVNDFSYYKGTGSVDGGCINSDDAPYDNSGTGDAKDDCLFAGGVNYCSANKDKHCKTTQGSEVCDDGCIGIGTELYCDAGGHPDVGEGDSNYFDSDGTCSVIGASASRGFCNEMGGTWDETEDYQETSCPTGTGNCSVASAGLCRACFDAGGTWTPDENSEHSDETKASLETGALIKSTNEKLDSIEHGQRMTMESIQSTMKSGDGKVVAAIEALGEKLDKPKEEEEEKSFTTTTQDVDKSAFLSMFDSSAQEAIKARVVTAQAEYDSQIRSILAEAKTIFSVTVPNAIGYQARRIELSYGSVDASLSRYSDFFKALAGPIMMLCSLIAALAILRD